MEELWKDIEGFEGYYKVSNFGRVKGVKRYVNHWRGGKQVVNEKVIQPCFNERYNHYKITKQCKRFIFLAHRLVAKAFIPNPKNKPEVNHIDGDKKNNRVDNLEWCTRKENYKHASETGLMKSGEENHMTKLTKDEVLEIKRLTKTTNLVDREISELFNASRKTICNIKNGKTWKHINKK